MKSILKLSLVSLCASGAVISTTQLARANHTESASSDSDKQLVITEPAGASTTQQTTTTYQNTGTTYQSGATIQGSTAPSGGYYASSGTTGGAPNMVTGRDQDAYANCILHQYQAGKGSARATDEHFWNNVSSDRLYAQYPAGGASYQNYAYNSPSSSSTWSSSQSSSSWSSGQQGLWYGPDGKVYNSATSMTPISGGASSSFSEPAGGSSSQSSSIQSSGDQSSATQSGTSGAQSSTELKSSQNQSGSATSEAAGAKTSTSSSDQSNQNSPSSTATSPDQSSTSSSSSDQSAQPSSASGQGSSEKVRSTLQSDSTLSPISSNVTVQDQNGKVALNGTVKSEAEKQQIVSKAEELAGSGNVIDNLQVKADSSNP